MSKRKSQAYIGTSGWQYDHWKTCFYPEDLPKKEWLGFYAETFGTVEVNSTFYGLPSADSLKQWMEAVPKHFIFSLKLLQYATHRKYLKDPESMLGGFLECLEVLDGRAGPVLVQLPPRWNCNAERLDAFLDAAPKEYRWALEMRNESWLCEEVYDILRRHGAALVVHDMIDDHPEVTTADWIYYRFHGDHYAGHYSDAELDDAAARMDAHRSEGRDVYAYFNNDADGCAPADAQKLAERLG